MNITICGSIAFFDEMVDTKKKLESLGHTVKIPPTEVQDGEGNMIPVKQYYSIRKAETANSGWVWERMAQVMKSHFDKVAWADAILVLNHTKKEIKGYVGANTLLEMGLAFHLNKPIFLFDQIPELSYKEEILGMQPILIQGDLNQVR